VHVLLLIAHAMRSRRRLSRLCSHPQHALLL
jgi:hypothetical protein